MSDIDEYIEMWDDNLLGSEGVQILMNILIAEVKRLRLLFRPLLKDMSADEYIEWCNKIGCPDGLEVEAMKND
tara:strand:- start:1698 stop:1916 length:219 start_codon:yes stop_codon:yes gene_type:complete